jgi:hypothetical protein
MESLSGNKPPPLLATRHTIRRQQADFTECQNSNEIQTNVSSLNVGKSLSLGFPPRVEGPYDRSVRNVGLLSSNLTIPDGTSFELSEHASGKKM